MNKTEENNKFEFYTDLFDVFSLLEIKDELGEILGISNITPNHLQDKTLGPRNVIAYRKISLEKRQTDGYFLLLMSYARSPF